MTEVTWEKTGDIKAKVKPVSRNERMKFLVGGGLILVAIAYLIFSGTVGGAQYFITIDDLVNNPDYVGTTVRVTGAVDGETIMYDEENLIIEFEVANVPTEIDDLAKVLHEAVNDPDVSRVPVYVENQVKPDLLQHEAQAIMTGELGEDGVFYAGELLLKCPSRYEEGVPEQVEAESEAGSVDYAG